MIYYTDYNSPLGNLTIASDGTNIIGLWIQGQKYFKENIKEEMVLNSDIDILKQAVNWLDRYFNGEKPSISELNISPSGTEFRKTVWKVLCKIPYGQVVSYKYIASEVSKILNKENMSVQAVGSAIGHNPISIIIPCHRVIGTNGELKGYAAGLKIKSMLLKHEKVNIKK